MRSIPTSTAWVVLVVGAAAAVGGIALDWSELIVLAVACGGALLVAVPFVLGRSAVRLTRTITRVRVTVGEQSVAELRATNETGRPMPAISVEERLDGIVNPIEIPTLGPRESMEFLYQLPTARRGVFDIGPTTVSKGDPLGLLRRSIGETPVERLWVHPRVRVTNALPAGFAKDLEGPTFDTSPAGDIAFHTIREYEAGDDVRHVHWMSTARKGALMVRQYVDNRRPQIATVLDTRLGTVDADLFELAIEIAASIGTSEIARGMPFAIRAGGRSLLDGAVGIGDELLDALALLRADDVDPGDDLARVMREAPRTTVLVLVTGGLDGHDLLESIESRRRAATLVVVNCHHGDAPIAVPRAKVLNPTGLDEFAAAWNRLR